jgi:glutamate-1-semialdehyde 2,1-aminomutase
MEGAERLFKDQGHQIAGVIVEPMLGNAFGIMPEDGFLQGLRRLCTDYGSVLIFDEVKTGFRMGLGGAGEYFGIDPDLGTFAKAMGNGFPVAAIAGRGNAIKGWAEGGIAQAGTYSANGVSVAAAGATIAKLATGEPYARIETVGRMLMDGFAAICAQQSVPAHVLGVPAMFGLVFSHDPPRDFRDAANHDEELYGDVIRRMIGKGVFPVDDALEPWFLCAAHTEEDAAKTLAVFEESLREARA